MEIIIQIFLTTLALYTAIGVLFGIYFFIKGAFILDNGIAESKWSVRLILFPGATILWPLLLIKIINKSKTKL